jgi:hypothetical protein
MAMKNTLYTVILVVLTACSSPVADEPILTEPLYAPTTKLMADAPYGIYNLASKTMHFEIILRPDGTIKYRSYDDEYHGVWKEILPSNGEQSVVAQMIKISVNSNGSISSETLTMRITYMPEYDAWNGYVGAQALWLTRVSHYVTCM